MSTIDQQFIEYIVKALVSYPDKVVVNRRIDEKGVLLELAVAPDDLGRVIGKRGTTAQSLRALLRALGTKNDARYNLKIVDVDRDNGDDYQAANNNQGSTTSSDGDNYQSVDDGTDEAVENSGSGESDLAKKTRAELADLDDLDI
jgi:predicted RNA-binding protein YlqC (UPF0109 family)